MRVNTTITKQGYFWLPNDPDKKLPGTLIIKDRGIITLNILGIFDKNYDIHNSKYPSYERILGTIESYGNITLNNCFCNRIRQDGNISIVNIVVNRALLGASFDKKEDELFQDFVFSIEGLDEWISISGFQIETRDFKNKEPRYSYSHPEEITIKLENKMLLTIQSHFSESSTSRGKNINISEKNYFKLSSSSNVTLDQFIATAYKITTFLCLANNQTVSINSVQITSKTHYFDFYESDNGKYLHPITVFYASNPYNDIVPSISSYDMLFRLPDIKEDLEYHINQWIDSYSIINPSLMLYFDAEKYQNTQITKQLLLLIQGLESFHRNTSNETYISEQEFLDLTSMLYKACPQKHKKWLESRISHANELPLRKRLYQLISKFRPILDLNNPTSHRLAQNITNIRNYLTHYNQNLESQISKQDPYELLLKVKTIFQLLLLERIGFSEDVLSDIYTKKFKHYFDYKRTDS